MSSMIEKVIAIHIEYGWGFSVRNVVNDSSTQEDVYTFFGALGNEEFVIPVGNDKELKMFAFDCIDWTGHYEGSGLRNSLKKLFTALFLYKVNFEVLDDSDLLYRKGIQFNCSDSLILYVILNGVEYFIELDNDKAVKYLEERVGN